MHHFQQEMNLALVIDDTYTLFYMPLFFLLSGLFYKNYNSTKHFLIRKINSLAVPFFFFFLLTSVLFANFAHFVVGLPMERSADGLGWKSLYAFIWPEQYFNNPIWFIWCLFVVNILFYGIIQISRKIRYRYVSLLSICLAIGCLCVYLGKEEINIGANIDTAMSAIPFFCFGYILKNHTSILQPNSLDKYNILFIVASFLIAYGCATTGYVNYLRNAFSMPGAFVYIGGIAGTLGVLFLSKMIGRLPLVSYWGRYSIMILVTHQPMIKLHIKISSLLGLSGVAALMCSLTTMMLSYMLIIPLMKRYLPYVTAQKDLIKVN